MTLRASPLRSHIDVDLSLLVKRGGELLSSPCPFDSGHVLVRFFRAFEVSRLRVDLPPRNDVSLHRLLDLGDAVRTTEHRNSAVTLTCGVGLPHLPKKVWS